MKLPKWLKRKPRRDPNATPLIVEYEHRGVTTSLFFDNAEASRTGNEITITARPAWPTEYIPFRKER